MVILFNLHTGTVQHSTRGDQSPTEWCPNGPPGGDTGYYLPGGGERCGQSTEEPDVTESIGQYVWETGSYLLQEYKAHLTVCQGSYIII